MISALELRSRIQIDREEVDIEFDRLLSQINDGKSDFSDDEQVIISSWVEKLSEPMDTEEQKTVRNDNARALWESIKNKQLSAPFNEPPPEGELTKTYYSKSSNKKGMLNFKPPCSQNVRSTSKSRKNYRSLPINDSPLINEFEDPEEMAKVVARSKGQSLAEFISAISRHTRDFGQELCKAMKLETNSFREYVDSVLSQRIQDLTDVLDEEQNRELQKIKKDIDKWKVELSLVKRRIEEMIPEFDLNEYKSDENYLKKMFQIKPELSEGDPFKKWTEESLHRLKWTNDRICKTMQANEQIMQEITNLNYEISTIEAQDSAEQQSYLSEINCEMADYKALISEREKLIRGNNQLLAQLKSMAK